MTERPLVLCSDIECRFTDQDVTRMRDVAQVEFSPTYELDELQQRIRDAQVLVASCFASIPAELIAAGPQLLGIVKYGVGTDNIDLAAAADRRILVANCPDYGSGAVADHAFALMIALARKLTAIDSEFRRNGWFWPADQYCGVDLEGKTLGLIGLGRIGRKMARRATGFEMRLVACDPYADPLSFQLDSTHIESANLDDLLARSDFISVHCTLTPETRQLLGEREFRLMRSTAVLIDVSRGAMIDETALLAALRDGRLAGAGLDVFPEEPLPPVHPLLSLPNVIVTPHLAWFTKEAAARQSAQAADAVLDLITGRRPRSVVNAV